MFTNTAGCARALEPKARESYFSLLETRARAPRLPCAAAEQLLWPSLWLFPPRFPLTVNTYTSEETWPSLFFPPTSKWEVSPCRAVSGGGLLEPQERGLRVPLPVRASDTGYWVPAWGVRPAPTSCVATHVWSACALQPWRSRRHLLGVPAPWAWLSRLCSQVRSSIWVYLSALKRF